MHLPPAVAELEALGLPAAEARRVANAVARATEVYRPTDARGQDRLWNALRRDVLSEGRAWPFAVHQALYQLVFKGRSSDEPPRAWIPDPAEAALTNVGRYLRDRGLADYAALHRWSVQDRETFWGDVIERLHIPFVTPPVRVLQAPVDPRRPVWLPGAKFNIAEACLRGDPERVAMFYGHEGSEAVATVTYAALAAMSRRVAHGLEAMGLGPDDPVAIYMPMTPESVAAYLGVIRSGRPVVGIADASAPPDLANKVRISGARLLITVDAYARNGKAIPIYAKAVEAKGPRTVVAPDATVPKANTSRRPGDVAWDAFLGPDAPYPVHPRAPEDATNVLFSSGTTKDPKAIPWTHVTPIKAMTDAYFHHDVRPNDVLAWPTSYGWMMGPWLTYASLGLGAAMAVYNGDPRSRAFGAFVERAGVTMLGVVPKLVDDWRTKRTMEGLDWSRIRRFSSTAETSNPDDMLYLMHLAGYAPIIEYCGGTEIGGGYVTGTLVQPASPGLFTTPALGSDFVLLDDQGRAADRGEAGLVPPSIGLSNTLLNGDHDAEYFEGFPRGPGGQVLRRHGDLLERRGAFFRHLGRKKDFINVHGVKTSSEEIRNVIEHPEVEDTKPVAVDVGGTGRSSLVVYAVPRDPRVMSAPGSSERLRDAFNRAIKERLNPLLAHVEDVVLVPELPQAGPGKTRTAEWFQNDYRARRPTADGGGGGTDGFTGGPGPSPKERETLVTNDPSAPAILVVDDEADILHSLQILIETTLPNVKVRTARSGPEAIEVLRRDPVQVIVTDYRMPGMNGLEFLVKAEQVRPGTKKMMITAFPKLELAIEAINDVHVDKFLVKPFKPEDFLRKVQEMITSHVTTPAG